MNGQFGVVAPDIRVADLVADGIEFHLGLLLGFGSHPRQPGDVFIQRLFQRGHHL